MSESATSLPQSVELIRTKLQQLTTSLVSLQGRVVSGDPLPPWPAILSSLNVSLTQLNGLVDVLARHEAQLSRVLIVPGVTFPSNQEGLLTTLLRTKLLPESEEWQSTIRTSELIEPITFLDDDEEQSASDWIAQQRQKRQWVGYYSRAEIDADFEIDREDIDDLRTSRRQAILGARDDLRAMLKFARSGREV